LFSTKPHTGRERRLGCSAVPAHLGSWAARAQRNRMHGGCMTIPGPHTSTVGPPLPNRLPIPVNDSAISGTIGRYLLLGQRTEKFCGGCLSTSRWNLRIWVSARYFRHPPPCSARFVDIKLLFDYPAPPCGGRCWFYTGHRSCEHPLGPVQCATSAQLAVDARIWVTGGLYSYPGVSKDTHPYLVIPHIEVLTRSHSRLSFAPMGPPTLKETP
jgi:hypothetical protein